MRPLKIILGLIAFVASVDVSATASAHPHILATARMDVVFSSRGDVQELREIWTYDPVYSSFAARKIDVNGDGQFSQQELGDFAKSQLADLKEFAYFTTAAKAGVNIELGDAADYRMTRTESGVLELSFTLPFKTPVVLDESLTIELYDKNFFAYFTMADTEGPVDLPGAPANCTPAIDGPKPINLKNTRSIPSAFWAALDGSSEAGRQFINRIVVTCR